MCTCLAHASLARPRPNISAEGWHFSAFHSEHSLSEVPLYTLLLVHKDQYAGNIRESVDSLCRDGTDTPMPPYIGTCTNFEDLSLFR